MQVLLKLHTTHTHLTFIHISNNYHSVQSQDRFKSFHAIIPPAPTTLMITLKTQYSHIIFPLSNRIYS